MTTPPNAVDYYLAPQSPWTYLGHDRFVRLAHATGTPVRLRPCDLGRVFPVSGGLPLGKRAPQRQAYRLVDLARWSKRLGVPLNLHPKFFPVAGDPAAKVIIAVDLHDGTEAALRYAGTVLAGVWRDELDIADTATLGAMLQRCGLDAARLQDAESAEVQARYDAETQQAIDAGVFGAPSYVVDGELFWGQDRLDFVEEKLAARGAA